METGARTAAAPLPETPFPSSLEASASQAASDALDEYITSTGRIVASTSGGAAVRRVVWGAHPTSGDRIDVLQLTSPRGGTAAVTTAGARLLYLREPGSGVNVILTPPSLAAVATDGHYLGALVGRTANRVRGAVVRVGDVDHALDANDGRASLHGGRIGFSRRLWTVATADAGVSGDGEQAEAWVTLRRHSGDGEGGHPGGVSVAVTYTLGAGGLRVAAATVNDGGAGPAVVNLTHHAYWVLAAGAGGAPVSVLKDIRLATPCDRLVLTDAACVATGELGDPPAGLNLTGTAPLGVPADCFLVGPPAPVGGGEAADARPAGPGAPGHTRGGDTAVAAAAAAAAAAATTPAGAMPTAASPSAPVATPADTDHDGLRLLASLTSAATGRQLRVWSDQPGFQLYTANGFDVAIDGYERHEAVCVEASAVLGTEEATCVLQEGEGRVQTTVYEVVPPRGG
ncbi:hypothetical protein MMPV_004514 [Pyropia vietnamensis]